MRRSTDRIALFAVLAVAIISVFGGAYLISRSALGVSTEQLHESQIRGCERGKLDRAANARAFRAQSDYLNLVLDAQSVKEDVKRAARKNQKVQDESATSLESRTGSRLDCQAIYPK